MTIEIHQPETEALIHQRLQSGAFHDVEDVILHAFKSSEPPGAPASGVGDVVEFFRRSPLFGLDLDLRRDKDAGRDVEL